MIRATCGKNIIMDKAITTVSNKAINTLITKAAAPTRMLFR